VRHMELTDVVVNPVLEDSLFEFTPPADAIVVDRG
jgi:outer membrane lipoprotein-sorting protein